MIHIARNGKQEGPFPLETIRAMVAARELKLEDLCWWEGCDSWVPVARIPGLNAGGADNARSVYAPPGSLITGMTSNGAVSAASVQALRGTRPWVLFLAILGILATVLMLLAGVGMFAVQGFTGTMPSSSMTAGMLQLMAVAYMVFGFLYVYPTIKLFKYSGAISALSRTGDVRDLERALDHQRGFWKFAGIMAILAIIAYAGLIVFMGMTFVSSAKRALPPPPVTTPP